MTRRIICRAASLFVLLPFLFAPSSSWAAPRRLATASTSGFGPGIYTIVIPGTVDTTSVPGLAISEMAFCFDDSNGGGTDDCAAGNYTFVYQVLSAPDDLTITFSNLLGYKAGGISYQTCPIVTSKEVTGTPPQANPAVLCTPDPSGLLAQIGPLVNVTGDTTGSSQITIAFGQDGAGSYFPQGGLTFAIQESGVLGKPAPTVSGSGTRGLALIPPGLAYGSQLPQTGSLSMLPPPIVTFGSQPLHTAAALQSVIVTNGGLPGNNLTITGISVSDSSGSFGESNTCAIGAPMTPGSSCTILISFTPTASGPTPGSAMISISDNAPSGSQAISLAGIGDPSAVTLSAPTVLFGQTVTLTNTGTSAITVTTVAVDTNPATGAGDFIVSANSTCTDNTEVDGGTMTASVFTSPTSPFTGSVSVAAQGTCTLEIFEPGYLGSLTEGASGGSGVGGGPVSGTVIITEADNNTQTIALGGANWYSSLSPTVLSFGSTQIGQTSSAQTVPSFTFHSVEASAGFGVSTTPPPPCDSSPGCALDITFQPSLPGALTGSAFATLPSSNGIVEVALNGTGTGPFVSLSPSTLSFPGTKVGATSGAETITVTNTGTENVLFTSITATTEFAVDSNTTTCSTDVPVGSGQSCLIGLTFAPAAVGIRTGSLTVSDNVFGSPQTVSLSGVGGILADMPTGTVDFYGDGEGEPAVWRPSTGTWYVDSNSGSTGTLQQSWGLPGDVPEAADYDGDGKSDFTLWRPSNGTWYIIPSGNPKSPITTQWGLPDDVPVPADYDGDGKADVAVWRPSNGTWYILPSHGGTFTTKQWGLTGDVPVIGDYDGDGKADYAVWRPSNYTWYVILSSTGKTVVTPWGLPGDIPVEGDYDGDGKTDYAVWRPSTGTWYVILSSTGKTVTEQWGVTGDIPVVGDYNGDGKNDYAIWRPSNATWYITYSSGGTSVTQWGQTGDMPATHLASMIRRDKHIANFDGDRKADLAVFRPSNTTWYVVESSTGMGTPLQSFGTTGDVPVPGDYDGDGKTDLAVWRPSNQTWYVLQSSTGKTVSQLWGLSGDILVPGDYDGDGKTDYAIFRPSNTSWYVIDSSTGKGTTQPFGLSGDIPVPADYDGDGVTDLAVWRPSNQTWYVRQSSTGKTVSQQWGASGDIPVPGDYDGDTRADYTVFRPSNATWYTIQSSTGKATTTVFGLSGDIPVAKDYDGDEKTDIAVWRASNGTWYVLQSSNGKTSATLWGLPTDLPLNKPVGQ